MAFTDYFAPIKRVGQQYRDSIALFGCALSFLIAGDLCLRRVLGEVGMAAPALPAEALWAAVAATLLQPLGLIGLGLIGLGLCSWLILLLRHQLSFFYPLWGVGTLALMLISWMAAGGPIAPKALFGGALVLLGAGLLMRGGHSI